MLGKFTFLLLVERTLWYSFMQSQSARLLYCYPADVDVHRVNGADPLFLLDFTILCFTIMLLRSVLESFFLFSHVSKLFTKRLDEL